jgi:hypothetical protein
MFINYRRRKRVDNGFWAGMDIQFIMTRCLQIDYLRWNVRKLFKIMIRAIDGYLVEGRNNFAFWKFVFEHEAFAQEFLTPL